MQEVLTRLSSACEHGDPLEVQELFVEHAVLETVFCSAGRDEPLPTSLSGAEAIGRSLTRQQSRPSAWTHHSTHDYIVQALGDFGRVDAQFLLIGMVAGSGAAGSPAAAALEVIEAGSYHADLRRTSDGWKIWSLRVSRTLRYPFE